VARLNDFETTGQARKEAKYILDEDSNLKLPVNAKLASRLFAMLEKTPSFSD
jgi:hypothetical protein